jgi:hypothetical protein
VTSTVGQFVPASAYPISNFMKDSNAGDPNGAYTPA